MSFACDIVKDSISPSKIRLTTFVVTFPRFILSEFNTHRVLSRNSESSRAIPPEKQIERVRNNPFIPAFGTRVKGMGSGELNTEQAMAKNAWVSARDASVLAAKRLIELDVDKARVNRLLEPFMWHTVIVTATEWDNFFALRNHPDAQPEFRTVAAEMQRQLRKALPKALDWGEWHLPLVEGEEVEDLGPIDAARVSAGRCARVSYGTQFKEESPEDSQRRWDRLSGSGHWSPGEHPARAAKRYDDESEFIGNFRGWQQLRKLYSSEAVFQG